MNFRPELAAKVMAGEKTVTRRLTSTNPRSPWWEQDCKLRANRSYAVCPGRGKNAIGRVLVTDVRKVPLGVLDHEEAQREGFASVKAFEMAFRGINGQYDPTARVWRIEFTLERKA
jgi:hypothetical protein